MYQGLAALLVTGTPPEVFVEHPIIQGTGRTWQLAFSDLTKTAQEYLQNGQEEPTRHKVLYHTVRKLAEVGCTKEETYKAVYRANTLCGESHALDKREVDRIVEEVYLSI
jgi:hypothetical protein